MLFLLANSLTTHALTAATHTDAPGAGITAAAGTRLALQSPSDSALPCLHLSRLVATSGPPSG